MDPLRAEVRRKKPVIAGSLYRLLGRSLKRYEHTTPERLYDHFVDTSAPRSALRKLCSGLWVRRTGSGGGVRTARWRRLAFRLAWRNIMRSVGAAVRRDRRARSARGPGHAVDLRSAREHLPYCLGIFGRRVGRSGARWWTLAAIGSTTAELADHADRIAAARSPAVV